MTEIATPAWRTTFGSGLSACYMLGMVMIFIVGKLVSWRTLAGFSCSFPVLSLIMMFFIPESPSWLVTQGEILHTFMYKENSTYVSLVSDMSTHVS